jgi:hypothetical protein
MKWFLLMRMITACMPRLACLIAFATISVSSSLASTNTGSGRSDPMASTAARASAGAVGAAGRTSSTLFMVWLERPVLVRGILRDGGDNIPQLCDSAVLEPEDVNGGKLGLSRI